MFYFQIKQMYCRLLLISGRWIFVDTSVHTRKSFRQKLSLLFVHFGFFTFLSNKDSLYLFVLRPTSFPRGRY